MAYRLLLKPKPEWADSALAFTFHTVVFTTSAVCDVLMCIDNIKKGQQILKPCQWPVVFEVINMRHLSCLKSQKSRSWFYISRCNHLFKLNKMLFANISVTHTCLSMTQHKHRALKGPSANLNSQSQSQFTGHGEYFSVCANSFTFNVFCCSGGALSSRVS